MGGAAARYRPEALFGLETSAPVCHVRSAMGHADTPPQLPEVTDEAANTPRWVPLLGAGLFALAVLTIVVCHTGAETDTVTTPEAAAEAP